MNSNTLKGVVAGVACLLSVETLNPAIAQTTMLMGSATHNTANAETSAGTTARTATATTTINRVRLTPQRAQYDYRPAAASASFPRTVYQTRTVYVKDDRTYFQRHPKVKAATVGAGVGAAAGALTGLVTGRGVLRGGAIGAGAGAGVGLVRSSAVMKRHPIMNDLATGTLVGGGLGWAGSRRHGMIAKTAGVGAAIGLGVGLFKHLQ